MADGGLMGLLKMFKDMAQQQNQGFGGIGSGPDINFLQDIQQAAQGTGNPNSAQFRAFFNQGGGTPNRNMSFNGAPSFAAFGGQRALGQGGGPTAGSQINYAAINAFNNLPFAQQQMLAQRGMAPSFNDFTVTSPGGQTFGRQGGLTLAPQGRKQGGQGVIFNAAMRAAMQSAQRGGGQGSTGSLGNPFDIAGNVTQNLDNVINRLGQVNNSVARNKSHNQNLASQAGLAQLRQRAAASGNLDRFGQIAANFLGTSEQARRNSMADQSNAQTSQLLQALGLKTDLMAKLAQAAAAAQPGTNSFLGMF